MIEQFDPVLFSAALLVWPATKSIVFLGAAAMNMWSRREDRKRTAERIMRLIHSGRDEGGPNG